jgi:hypothetical protein
MSIPSKKPLASRQKIRDFEFSKIQSFSKKFQKINSYKIKEKSQRLALFQKPSK